MKITMVDYTGRGYTDPARYAANILIFSKNTRLLNQNAQLRLAEIVTMGDSEVKEELKYISRSIPSSWEFISYTFLIQEVTRAFTHQLVRCRHASYAQQSMRVTDMEGFTYREMDERQPYRAKDEYKDAMVDISEAYRLMLHKGASVEEARGVLPTNIHTNILVGMNLRTIVELVRKRSSARVQGEYREFVELLQESIQEVHPFTRDFFGLDWAELRHDLGEEIKTLPVEARVKIAKLFDKVTEGVTS